MITEKEGVKSKEVKIPVDTKLSDQELVKSAKEKFIECQLDQTKNYPPPPAILQLMQKGNIYPFLTLKSFSLWHGKAKSKKTTALALVIAAYICRLNNTSQIKFDTLIPGIALFFDCEQGESYAARTMKMVLKLSGLQTSENLIYCDLREYSPPERFEIIEEAVKCTKNVTLVVIDGLVDLMTDFMDAAEAHATILNILKLCSRCNVHFAGILHQNKADKNARAHIGSIASQKCEVEISVEVDAFDKNQSIVSCIRSRDISFEDFAIRWDQGDLPHIVQDWTEKTAGSAGKKAVDPSEMPNELTLKILSTVFEKSLKQKYSELVFNVQLAFEKHDKKIGVNKAKKFIQFLQNEGLIKKDGIPGSTVCVYELVTQELV